MSNKTIVILITFCLSSFVSCSQVDNTTKNETITTEANQLKKSEPHRYGGWYCPDNLNGFPAVDIKNWDDVPVVNGRMPSKEETRNGTSLIFVDAEKYPNAKPLAMTMPKLAKFYNHSSKREELIIVIQAVNVDNDSIVGFRYLNGGNGSARIDEVNFLTDMEVLTLPNSKFINQNIKIKASPDVIWQVLTDPKNAETLKPVFNNDNTLKAEWRKATNVNYQYPYSGKLTSSYAGELFGNYYIQNDYSHLQYTEKFLLLHDEDTGLTELKVVCGPFGDDFEVQKKNLEEWGEMVKGMSE